MQIVFLIMFAINAFLNYGWRFATTVGMALMAILCAIEEINERKK